MDKKKRTKSLKKIFNVLNFVVVGLFILLAVYTIYNRQFFEITTLNTIQKYGFISLFVVNFFLEFIPQLITPAFTFIPAILLEMNLYLATLFIVLGSFLGSLSGFLVGRKFGYEVIEDFFGKEKSQRVVDFMDKYGRFAVFFAAITPLPYVPMIVGSLRLSKKNFAFFGIIPRTIALIVFGYLFYLGLITI